MYKLHIEWYLYTIQNNYIIQYKTPLYIGWCTNLTYSVVTKLTYCVKLMAEVIVLNTWYSVYKAKYLLLNDGGKTSCI